MKTNILRWLIIEPCLLKTLVVTSLRFSLCEKFDKIVVYLGHKIDIYQDNESMKSCGIMRDLHFSRHVLMLNTSIIKYKID